LGKHELERRVKERLGIADEDNNQNQTGEAVARE